MDLIKSIPEALLKPKACFEAILLDDNFKVSKKHIWFSVFMNVYYVFVPSFFVGMHILAPLVVMTSIGMMYYFAQKTAAIYQEQSMIGIDDDKFFYKVAYCFALANIPAFILSWLTNILSWYFAGDFILGLFVAFFLNIFVLVFALIYPLKMMALINRRKNNFTSLIKLVIESCIVTVKELLGYRAIRDIYRDSLC